MSSKRREEEQEGKNIIPAETKSQQKDLTYYLPLYKAALKGDLESSRRFLNGDPEAVTARITRASETALHLAAAKGRNMELVEELVHLMPMEALAMKNYNGNTALSLAAIAGTTKASEVMVMKNMDLTQIRNNDGRTPLLRAAQFGHKEMVWYLLSVTRDEDPSPFQGQDGARLLNAVITADFYGIHIKQYESTRKGSWGCTGERFPYLNKLFWNIIGNLDSSIKQVYNTKLMHIQSLELLKSICDRIFSHNSSEIVEFFDGSNILSIAAKFGTIEVIMECLQSYPDLMWMNIDDKNIFHIAVEHRQWKVFNFIYGLHTHKNVLATHVVKSSNNNILHLAAKLAPSSQLNSVSGAALQMQRELQWFKEVEKIVQPSYRELENSEGRAPQILFTEEHNHLVEKGEKWMKDTASSCMVVATLIATVVFAAAFTVPGGNNNDRGTPIFLQTDSFLVFVVSDALALFSSLASVLVFLSILTSRYAEEDFLEFLPKMLIIGLATLFFSIANMILAFSVTLFILLEHRLAWVAIPIAFLACVPVTLFALLQFPLFVQVLSSTYGSGIFHQQSEYQLY